MTRKCQHPDHDEKQRRLGDECPACASASLDDFAGGDA